jgi:integrase/recombinase XerD
MAKEMKFDEFAADCHTRGLTPGTAGLYISHARLFQGFLQARGKSLLKADRLDIRDHIEELRARGLRTKTLHQHLIGLSAFYEWQIFEGRISRNPVLEVRRRLKQYKAEGEQQTHKLISVEEASELVEALVDIRDKALVLLFFKTGIRKNELITLDVDSINWKDQSLTLKPAKKRSNRKVFFDDEAGYYLKRWLEVREKRKGADEPALFLATHGRRLERGVDEVIRKAALQVNLHDESSERMEDHFSAHCCRHWFTTYLLRAGMRREYVAWLRGDVIREAVDIYFHINPEDVRKQYLAHMPQLGI